MTTYLLRGERARFELVTRWLTEWAGRHHYVDGEDRILYNVDNNHHCFNERSRACIVRPFVDVDYFYGCVKCGKYHFCYQHSQTCERIDAMFDVHNDKPICVYSGKTITNASNTFINYSDEEILKTSTSYFGPTHSGALAERRRLHILDSMASRYQAKPKNGISKKEQRQIDKQDMALYFRRKPAAAAAAVMNDLIVDEDSDCDIEGTLSYHDDIDDDDEELDVVASSDEATREEDDDDNDEDDDSECDSVSADSTIRSVIERSKKRKLEQCGAGGDYEDDGERFYDQDGGGGGDDNDDAGDDYGDMGESDCATQMKNRHNNRAYWDCYYAFLFDKKFSDMDLPRDDMGMTSPSSSLTMNNDTTDEESSSTCGGPTTTNPPAQASVFLYQDNPADIFVVDPRRLDTPQLEDIENEIRRIVHILLMISLSRPLEEVQGLDELLQKLTRYYYRIVVNIVELIYNSSYIYKLAMDKHEKHEKQGKNSYTSKIQVSIIPISVLMDSSNATATTTTTTDATRVDIEGPAIGMMAPNPIHYQNVHDILCPKKICASLLLQLFTDKFYLDDSMTNHIHVWVADPWLLTIKNRGLLDKVIMDYNIITDPLNNPNPTPHLAAPSGRKKIALGSTGNGGSIHLNHKNTRLYENLFFKRDLTTNSNIIKMALTSYGKYPLWLTSKIFK